MNVGNIKRILILCVGFFYLLLKFCHSVLQHPCVHHVIMCAPLHTCILKWIGTQY